MYLKPNSPGRHAVPVACLASAGALSRGSSWFFGLASWLIYSLVDPLLDLNLNHIGMRLFLKRKNSTYGCGKIFNPLVRISRQARHHGPYRCFQLLLRRTGDQSPARLRREEFRQRKTDRFQDCPHIAHRRLAAFLQVGEERRVHSGLFRPHIVGHVGRTQSHQPIVDRLGSQHRSAEFHYAGHVGNIS